MSPEEIETLRGNMAAIEHMLGQLYVLAIRGVADPKAWLKDNIAITSAQISRTEVLSTAEQYAAETTIHCAMETARRHFESEARRAEPT